MKALVYNPSSVGWAAAKLLASMRPAIHWSALAGLRYRDVPVPELPGEGWVRLRTRLGGICGTDLAIVLQKNHPASILRALSSTPMILGHENVAVIDKVGADVPDQWQSGRRVCVEPALSCAARGVHQQCNYCRQGLFSLCLNTTSGGLPPGLMVGVNRMTSGSWAPYFLAHHSQLHAVPDEIGDLQAVLVDPLACALHAVLRRPPLAEEHALVTGGGIIALGVVSCIRALGVSCRVYCVVWHESQQRLLAAAGADDVLLIGRKASRKERYETIARLCGGRRLGGPFGNQTIQGGFDVVYDCAGSAASLTDSLHFARPRGTVVEVGTPQIGMVDATCLWMNELNVLGAYGRQIEEHTGRRAHTYEHVFELLASGGIRTEGWPVRTYRLGEYGRAFSDLIRRGKSGIVKAAFDHRSEA